MLGSSYVERFAARLGFVPTSAVATEVSKLAASVEEKLRENVDPRSRYRQTAVGVLDQWLGGIEDPDEVLRRTNRTRASLREILRDAEVTQALDTRLEAVLSTPWRFETGTGGAQSRAVKRITAEFAPHAEAFIGGVWESLLYGYDVHEIVYAPRSQNGFRYGIEKLVHLPFEWFKPMPDGSLKYFPEDGKAGSTGIDAPPWKWVLAQRKAEYRNPYGQSMLSILYWPVSWRMQGWQSWLDFLDTFGQPILVGMTASFEQFVQALKMQGVKRAVGYQPASPDEKIHVINASHPGEFERLEEALNRVIQRVVLGQTLTSDTSKSGGGAYALGKVHNEVRHDKKRADIRLVCGAVQRFIGTYWETNGLGSAGTAPLFVMQDNVGLEKERADRDTILHGMGVRFTPEYFTERYDLEDTDFEIKEDEPPPEVPGFGGNIPTEDFALGAQRFTPSQEVIERGIAKIVEKVGAPLSADKLRSAIAAATDIRDLEERLAALLDRRDPRFTDALERSAFAADVLGYIHASEETVPSPKE